MEMLELTETEIRCPFFSNFRIIDRGKEKWIHSREVKLDLVRKIEQGDLRVIDFCRT
jgi:hypothetical protein